jgi:membrane protein YqaA with SNARE-associated domain
VQKLLKLTQTKSFKKIIVFIGIILALGSILISVNPEPFLKTGYLGVFIYGILGPVTTIIPVMSQHLNIYILATVAAAGMVLNDTLAYIIGRNADVFIDKSKKVMLVEKWVDRYGYITLVVIAILPVPYDFIGLLAGYLDLSFKKYAIPLFVGKFIRIVFVGMGTTFVLSKL